MSDASTDTSSCPTTNNQWPSTTPNHPDKSGLIICRADGPSPCEQTQSSASRRTPSLEYSDPDINDKSLSLSIELPVTIPPPSKPMPFADEISIKSAKIVDVEMPKVTSPQSLTATTAEPTKGVNFTNIFGATKKVIFRTTQNIIDNHERKNALKAKNAAAAVAAAAAAATPNDTNDKKSPKHMSQVIKDQDCEPSPHSLSPVTGSCSPIGSSTGSTTPTASTIITSPTLGQRRPPNIDDDVSDDDSHCNSIVLASDKCHNGLLRFLESPIFNVHFALHYLFYSKEPGVLSFIGNKIFSFKDPDVDLYIPQLILMYIQMNELAEVLDPYLVYRCRKAVDFCLKCLWLLESYNYNADSFFQNSCDKKTHLRLMRQIYPINEKHHQQQAICNGGGGGGGSVELKEIVDNFPAIVKTHHR